VFSDSRSPNSGERSPITRLLVANRGEIARRVFRTAHAMGIATVAVYADGDASAPFVGEADQAVALGGTTALETYLDMDKLLAAASRTSADAIHPGYGFLAENAEFAQAVIDAGLLWVGPSPAAIASMGDKLAAKRLMVAAGVPTLASVEVAEGSNLAAAVADLGGFPVLVKAAAGGGGKGMRVVNAAAGLAEAVSGAKREAASAFGDDTVFLEKYLPAPRHVEIQVLGDQHGHLVHLYERECSIQRRHQKIIEEAPSPALSEDVRAALGDAALTAARTIGYHSTGTVEFLLDGEGDTADFYFLEVNTRIQVEHPVTEEVTGIDLVREQLRVAAGQTLGYGQQDIAMRGHAIEARLYAEDPAQGFLPATGIVHGFDRPRDLAARIDSGVEAGSVVGIDFDPMLAKVIVHAPTRDEAARRLALVLDRMVVAGVTTNRDFLVSTLRTAEFLAGDTTTDFIERVTPYPSDPSDEQVVAAVRAAALFDQVQNRRAAKALAFLPSGYRNSSMPPEQRSFLYQDRQIEVRYSPVRGRGFEMTVDDGDPVLARVLDVSGTGITVDADGLRSTSTITRWDQSWNVQGEARAIELVELPRFPDSSAEAVAGGQTAPMPGKVLAVAVEVGDGVVAGQALVVVEAMKMEHSIAAPGDGVVTEIRCAVGDQVDNGQVLIVLAEPAPA